MNFVDQIENLNPAKYLRPSSCEIKFSPKQVTIRGTTSSPPPPGAPPAPHFFFFFYGKALDVVVSLKATNITFPSNLSLLRSMSYGVTGIALLDKSIYCSYNVLTGYPVAC